MMASSEPTAPTLSAFWNAPVLKGMFLNPSASAKEMLPHTRPMMSDQIPMTLFTSATMSGSFRPTSGASIELSQT